jgi:hypothetical protein
MNGDEDHDMETLDWSLEERDAFMAAHEGDEGEPATEVLVEVDE